MMVNVFLELFMVFKNKSLVVLMFDLHGPDLSHLRSEITYPSRSWWYVCTKSAVDTGTPVRHSFFLRYSRCQDQPLHAHENEEWYQKWLRRQRNQPSHTVEIGAGKCWHDPRIASPVFQLLLHRVGSMKLVLGLAQGPKMPMTVAVFVHRPRDFCLVGYVDTNWCLAVWIWTIPEMKPCAVGSSTSSHPEFHRGWHIHCITDDLCNQ